MSEPESGAPSITSAAATRAGGSPAITVQWAALSAGVPAAWPTGSLNVTTVSAAETERAETAAGGVASTTG